VERSDATLYTFDTTLDAQLALDGLPLLLRVEIGDPVHVRATGTVGLLELTERGLGRRGQVGEIRLEVAKSVLDGGTAA